MTENTFIIVPPHIVGDDNLTVTEKMLFGLINGLTSKYGYCFATNGYLGSQIGLSDGRVSKHISKLEKKGYLRLVITKIKKDERTGQTGEKYGTIRKIYVYQNDSATRGLVENDHPPLVENDQSIVKIDNKERGDTPPKTTNGYQWMKFSFKEQLQLLRSVMTITGFTDVDASSMITRLSKSVGENKLQTAYEWLYNDVVDGKLSAHYFDFTSSGGGVVNGMPETFEEAEDLMEERIEAIEKERPGFIASKQKEVPDAKHW